MQSVWTAGEWRSLEVNPLISQVNARTLQALARIGDHIEPGQTVAVVQTGNGGEVPVVSLLGGVLRGLIRTGIPLTEGVKVGDVDPRDDPRLCFLVSDKALAIGGGVLEALLSGSGQDSRGPQKG